MTTAHLADGVIKVIWRYTNSVGHQCRTAMYYTDTDTITQDMVDAYSTALGSALTDRLGTSARYDGITLLVGDGTASPDEWVSGMGNGAGGNGDAKASPQVQVLIKKFSRRAGRHGRGRLYMPDVPEGEIADDGSLSSGAHTDYDIFAGHVRDALPPTLGASSQWSLFDAKTGEATFSIAAFVVEDKVATQRRRFKR